MKCSIVILFLVLALSEGAKLSSYIRKCSKDDAGPTLNECLLASARAAWPKLVKGDNSVHFHVADPLAVPHMYTNVAGNLRINMSEANITGMTNMDIKDLRMDFNKKTIDVDFFIDKVSTIGHYDIAGRILVLPIEGNGHANITFVGGNYKFHIDFEVVEKNRKHYFNVRQALLTYTLDRAYFQLDNLFNGNKQLGEQMGMVLNENWREVNAEIGTKIGECLGIVFGGAVGNMFKKVPLEELFLDFS